MRIIGQGSPKERLAACARRAVIALAVGVLTLVVALAQAADVDLRLRFAWGSASQSPQKWHGKITVAGATLDALQPLGIEADEAAALRLVDNQILVAPLVRRAFDGCDVTIVGDETAIVKVELQYSPESPAKVIEVPLGQLRAEQFRSPLDDLGGDLLIHRTPGDKLRVRLDRDHLVFQPNEAIKLQLTADLKAEAAESPLTVRAGLYRTGSSDVLWENTVPYDPASAEPLSFEFAAPPQESAYRVALTVQRPAGLARRLVPWDKNDNVVASREMELVVVDPAQRLPQLSDQWEVVSTIEPASSSWWQRAGQWTQFDKLPGFSTPRPLGNVRPGAVAGSSLGLVELPAKTASGEDAGPAGDDAPWQAYLLPVRRVGEPHAVEIELPRGVRHHLAVSVVEPDAAGRVLAFGRDCGVYDDGVIHTPGQDAAVETHRIVFWPRTKSPALLLANRSDAQPVQYGKIRLLRRATVAAPTETEETIASDSSRRLVAAYIGTPRFAESLGAAEERDAVSGLSVDGWNTFLLGANRLAQQLRAGGYNAAIISVAAEGSSLTPIERFGASPRFDTGLLSGVGADPVRKDVLEVLLRVFDREGLKLIPAVQLGAPMPGLEALAAQPAGNPGVQWFGRDGRSWGQHFPADAAVTPRYNLLQAEVQAEVGVVTDQLLTRYGKHPALAGLAVQLTGSGYGVLPGLAWGMDDATVARFAAAAQVALPAEGPGRFQQRFGLLLGQYLPAWKQWRSDQVTQFYAGLAARVARDRPELQLSLCTEDMLSGAVASERLRQAVGGRAPLDDAFDELGVDLERLAATPGISVLRPRRLGAEESVDSRAADQRINAAQEFDHALAGQPNAGELLFHGAARLRLASFDAQSPFGADKTYLALNSASVPAGDGARQALIGALASHDFITLASGGESLLLAENDGYRDALRAFQELPPASADVRTERRQPVTLRVYREENSTTICLLNESRWPVDVTLPLEGDGDLVWRQLGADSQTQSAAAAMAANPPSTGSLAAGPQKWTLTLPPFGMHARRFSSRSMRIGAFTPQVSPAAAADLARRVEEIQQRMMSLNIERPYHELQNPEFDLVDDNGRLRGWQPRMGQAGAVDVAMDEKVDDVQPAGRSVHLRSEDALGVAVQSHLFAIPATGQILVRAKVRAADLQPGARLYAWIEYESGGVMQPRHFPLGDAETLTSTWVEREFAFDELPLASTGKMRVQFHLTGHGQAWVDDVRLYDLRFAEAQVVELSKRLMGAQAALEEGQLIDCQRLVDGYLPRRLVENIPPPMLAAKPSDMAPATPEAAAAPKGMGARIKGIVPRILR
ncbi:MAG: hypothetical protein H0T51_15710 [Pirellulales bacterium]|nr:hypothetical protein [Pirellulales bacterium]